MLSRFLNICAIEIATKNMELMDFVRGISPALTNLFECF